MIQIEIKCNHPSLLVNAPLTISALAKTAMPTPLQSIVNLRVQSLIQVVALLPECLLYEPSAYLESHMQHMGSFLE